MIAGTDHAYLSTLLAPAGGPAMRTAGANAEDLRAVPAFRALGITL